MKPRRTLRLLPVLIAWAVVTPAGGAETRVDPYNPKALRRAAAHHAAQGDHDTAQLLRARARVLDPGGENLAAQTDGAAADGAPVSPTDRAAARRERSVDLPALWPRTAQ